jgi:hypothetical protein
MIGLIFRQGTGTTWLLKQMVACGLGDGMKTVGLVMVRKQTAVPPYKLEWIMIGVLRMLVVGVHLQQKWMAVCGLGEKTTATSFVTAQ